MVSYKMCIALFVLCSLSLCAMNPPALTATNSITTRIKNGKFAHKWYKKLIKEALEEYESDRLQLSHLTYLGESSTKEMGDSIRIHASTLHYLIESLQHEAKKNDMIVALLRQGRWPRYAGLPILEEMLKYKIDIYQSHIKRREAQIRITSSPSRKQKLKREIYTLLERKNIATEMRTFAATTF